ncbi:MAG: hypothetical protein OXF84_11610 [Bacteroidetes bacterium]|nr:hypothetical protein [Bacteroidota bacterium]
MSKRLSEIAQQLKEKDKKVQLIYAFNGTGKTRLSLEFTQLIARAGSVDENPRHDFIFYKNPYFVSNAIFIIKMVYMNMKWFFAPILLVTIMSCASPDSTGLFEGSANIGNPSSETEVVYDSNLDIYTVAHEGAGKSNTGDEFSFVWKKMEGDLVLKTDVEFSEPSGHPQQKAGWMIRESLDSDAAYVDALMDTDGLVTIQWRSEMAGILREVTTSISDPVTLRLERTADLYTFYLERDGQRTVTVANITVQLPQMVYVGLAVSAQDAEAKATAQFMNVDMQQHSVVGERIVESTLETIDSQTGKRQILHQSIEHFEAPNWSPDSLTILYNSGGRLFHMPSVGGPPQMLDTQFADRCNNDHGYSPDGSEIALSHNTEDHGSLIYIVPSSGGRPRLVTEFGPSYWHGWSPDGQKLVYCARRNDNFDVYVIGRDGSAEVRLTDAPGLDDGPEYAPDGLSIYFNSERTGQMNIWQMDPDGRNQRPVTLDDEFGDWFPHPSPDGKWIAFLSYDQSVDGHPPNKDVKLRIMPADQSSPPRIIAHLFGGQGTLNVPSWSPDSRHFAFVSYRLVGGDRNQGSE